MSEDNHSSFTWGNMMLGAGLAIGAVAVAVYWSEPIKQFLTQAAHKVGEWTVAAGEAIGKAGSDTYYTARNTDLAQIKELKGQLNQIVGNTLELGVDQVKAQTAPITQKIGELIQHVGVLDGEAAKQGVGGFANWAADNFLAVLAAGAGLGGLMCCTLKHLVGGEQEHDAAIAKGLSDADVMPHAARVRLNQVNAVRQARMLAESPNFGPLQGMAPARG